MMVRNPWVTAPAPPPPEKLLARLLPFFARPPPPPPEPEPGLLTAWLLCATLCLVLTWLAIRRRVGRREEAPEGQRAVPLASALRLPFIGQMASTFRLGRDNINYGLSRFSFRYGRDLVLCEFGFIKFIFVHGPDAIKQIYTTHPFTDGGKFVAQGFAKITDSLPSTEGLNYLFGNGLFVADDDDRWWPIAHRILVKPFSRQGMMSMVPLMNEQADLLVERLAKDLGNGAGPIRIYQYTVRRAPAAHPCMCLLLWRLHDILLLLVVCARINRPFILPARLHCPHGCNTIARLWGNIRPPHRPLFYMPHIIQYW